MRLQIWHTGIYCFLTVFVASAQTSFAQEASSSVGSSMNESAVKMSDILHQKEYQQNEKITDMELNAQTGSLSRYSMQAYFGYTGPAINNLTDTAQPNPLNRPVPTQTKISGSVGVRYRMSSNDTLYFSTGVTGYFQPKSQHNPDIDNPGVEYDHSYSIGKVQMYSGIQAMQTTNSFYTALGEVAGTILKQHVKYNIPNSRFIIGSGFEAQEYFYDRPWSTKDGRTADQEFLFIPSVEYKIMDHFNFNTSYSIGAAHYRGVNAIGTYTSDPAALWLGVGYGITRDIYFKPYVAIYPQAVSWANTGVAFQTYISVF